MFGRCSSTRDSYHVPQPTAQSKIKAYRIFANRTKGKSKRILDTKSALCPAGTRSSDLVRFGNSRANLLAYNYG